MLGLIKRTCRDVDDVTTLKTLYCSLVRPRVEYASQVWNPYTKSNISRIESIKEGQQNSFLKVMTNIWLGYVTSVCYL